MNNRRVRINIYIIFFIFSLIIGFLILPNVINNSISSKSQMEGISDSQSLSKSNIIHNDTYYIAESEDDAWNRNVQPATNYITTYLILGGTANVANNNQRRIGLRWNVSIPNNAYIRRAYINLTTDNSYTLPGGYFYSDIWAYDTNSTLPFSNISEDIGERPRSSNTVRWRINNANENETLQSPDISSLLQPLVNRDDWESNGYFGLYIRPVSYCSITEYIQFWSFDSGTLYTGTLIVDWEETPAFTDVPTDQTVQNDTYGYSLSWTAVDDNPTTYNITRNDTGLVDEGVWQSGIPILYELPPLDEDIYNLTIFVYDMDGRMEADSVIINSSFLNLPVITEYYFIQNFSQTDFLQTGAGPFILEIYNSSPINSVEVNLIGYFPNYNLHIKVELLGSIFSVFILPYSENPITYDLSNNIIYNDSINCFQLIPTDDDQFEWINWAGIEYPIGLLPIASKYKNVTSIESGVLNIFSLSINGGEDFIYNQTVYNPLTMNISNRDITPPSFINPHIIPPKDRSSNHEIQLNASDNEYGSGIKDVWLYYSTDSGDTWTPIKMIEKNGIYYAGIPPQSPGTTILFYMTITDADGNVNQTQIFVTQSLDLEIPIIIWPLIGILIGTSAIVLIFRNFWRKKQSPNEIPHLKKSKNI